MKKQKIAKVIRVISIPPVMALFLFIVLFAGKPTLFNNIKHFIAGVVFLALVPVLAYPLQLIIPAFKSRGRGGQRKLAFIVTMASYTGMLIYGIVNRENKDILLISLAYFGTVFVLTIFNKLLHIKASGHAASCTSPLVFFIYYFSWPSVIPCALFFLIVLWSSIATKRHTVKEFLTGSLICAISFTISLLVTFVI